MNRIIRKVLTSRYLVYLLAALLLYAFLGFLLAPWLIGRYLPRFAQQDLHCRAAVDKIRINPFSLTVEAEGFSLQQEDGSPLVAVQRFFIDLETSSLWRWTVVLRELALDQPDIHLVIEPDGSVNFAKLAAPSTQAPGPEKSAENPLSFVLQSAFIRDGRFALVDRRQSIPADFALQGLNLTLNDLTTVQDHSGTYHLAATTEDGGSIQWQGDIALAPLRSKGTLSLNTIRIADPWKFFRDNTNLEQPAGEINATTEYELNAESSPVQLALAGLHVSFADLSLKLRDTDKAFLQLKKIELEAPHCDLATGDVHIERLLVADGAVLARIDDSGGINLQQILRAATPATRHGAQPPPSPAPESTTGQEEKAAEAAASPFKVQADAIEARNIAIDLDDASRKIPIKAAIAGVDLTLQAHLEKGSGKNSLVLQEISSEARGISVHGSPAQQSLFAAEKLTVAGGRCDLSAHSLSFARIAMHKGRLDAGLDADGKITWQQLFQTRGAGEEAMAPPQPEPPSPWNFLVKSFEIEEFGSQFVDLTTGSDKPVLNLQDVKVILTEIDGHSPMGFTVGFRLEEGGTGSVSGTVHPDSMALDADIKAAGLVLTSLQPYLEPYVTLKLQSAAATAQGHLRYGVPGGAEKAAYDGSFSLNDLRLDDIEAKTTYLSWDAVQLPTLHLTLQPNRLDVQEIILLRPDGEIIIGEDKTVNFARVLKKNRPGGNTATASRPAQVRPKNDQAAFPYRISKVRVKNGNLVFADLSLRPRFKTRIHALKGTITGLSSLQHAQAKIQLDGDVDRYGMAKINGVIRPNDFGSSSDIEMVFRNLELKNLSPYSGKFAGRLIKSGRISADLKYTLQDYKMVGDNKLVIDNLLLGEQVDNPEATNLPLDLAIALLQDANGRIDIGLPVSGDLHDPQFSIGSLIWKMFTNLITKAVTSPFLAMGHLLGGDSESFAAVEFDPGSAVLLPPEQEKLAKLAGALKDRPQLKLVIQGRYSTDADGKELKERSIRKTIATRLGVKLGPDDTPDPLDFTDSDTQDALEKLFTERFGKPSLDELEKGFEAGTVKPAAVPPPSQEVKDKKTGLFKKMKESLKLYKIIPGGKSPEQSVVWAGELYTRLVESEQVADETFRELAEKRARSIVTNLEGEGRIRQDRISLTPPEPLSGDVPPAATLSLDSL